jgi:hypothetical protein
LSEFLLRELSSRVDLATPEGRARLQAEAREAIMALPAAALRQQLLRRLASLVELPVEELERFYGLAQGVPAPSWPPRRAVAPRRAPTVQALDRAFGLAAMHPALAGEIPLSVDDRPAAIDPGVQWAHQTHPGASDAELSPTDLPDEILQWLVRLRSLPSGASFASVRALLADEPGLQAKLDAAGASPWSALSIDEARPEFHRALAELVLGRLEEDVAQLAEGGLVGPGDSERYQAAQRRMFAMKAAYGRVRR